MKESEVQQPPTTDEFTDLLRGAAAIAAYTGENYRQTVYKLSTGQLPGYKIGATWFARRSKVRARLLGETAAADGGA
jgi:hypothetical protein